MFPPEIELSDIKKHIYVGKLSYLSLIYENEGGLSKCDEVK